MTANTAADIVAYISIAVSGALVIREVWRMFTAPPVWEHHVTGARRVMPKSLRSPEGLAFRKWLDDEDRKGEQITRILNQ